MTNPSFDSWTIVFLIAAVQGLFTALVFWYWRRGQTQANRLLAFLLCLFSITLIEYVLYWTRYLYDFPHMTNVSLQFPFLYGPVLWLYFRTIYEGTPLQKRDLWHLVPYILGTLVFTDYYLEDASVKRAILDGSATIQGNYWLNIIQFWVRMVWMIGFAGWNLWYVMRQSRIGATARWASRLSWFYIVFVGAYISYFILIRFPFFNTSWDYHISAVMTAMIYLIAYSGYAQPAVFEGYQWGEPDAPAKYKNSGLTPEASRSLLQNLQLLMQEERIYHDPDISLDKLAERLNASNHHVSQVINEQLGASFFEYINRLRVEEAKELLIKTSRSDFHIIEIAYAVGFNNKVSFNLTFKKNTGLTPSEFRRNHSVSDESAGPASAR